MVTDVDVRASVNLPWSCEVYTVQGFFLKPSTTLVGLIEELERGVVASIVTARVLAVVMRRTVATGGSQFREPSDIERPGIIGCGDALNGHIGGRHCWIEWRQGHGIGET
jgi:hypothetical protein